MKLDKQLSKHIEKENFVKVYTSCSDNSLEEYQGFIFDYNDIYVLMSDMYDFNHDGFVIIKKSDINEIKHTENEKFFLHMLKKEHIKEKIFKRKREIKFKLASIQEIMQSLKSLQVPIICEHLCEKDELFQIGIIQKTGKKKAKMKYFNVLGEYNYKLLPVLYKSLTVIRIDSPYANVFYKYLK